MANVSMPGLYFARVKSFGWNPEKLKEKKYELVIRFQILSKFNGKIWDESVGGLETMGWFYPFKNDGGRNQGFRQMMMESFGWDGAKLSGIQALEQLCQIEVEERIDGAKKQLRVNWIHFKDWAAPEAVQTAQEVLDELDAAYGKAPETEAAKPAPAAASIAPKPAGR